MEKTRTSNSWRVLAGLTVISLLVGMLGFMPTTEAASLTDASDTISDSSPGATGVTHTFDFTINQNIPANGDILITFDSNFDLSGVGAGDVTCPRGGSPTIGASTVECSTSSAITATTALQVIVADVTSPAKSAAAGVADTYTHTIQTRNASDVVIENAQVMVAIIDTVSVSASVAATLSFKISGVATGTVVNTATTTRGTSTTTIPFGTISPGSANAEVAAQELKVTTNADYGFVVTVFQNHNLQSAAGSDIDSFKDGTPVSVPEVWASPSGTLDQENTYGHMGLTSDDSNLNSDNGSYPDFTGGKFGGLNGSSTYTIFAHTGPSDGSTQNKGLAKVAYKIELNALQEAGDYTNTLTYICTPSY